MYNKDLANYKNTFTWTTIVWARGYIKYIFEERGLSLNSIQVYNLNMLCMFLLLLVFKATEPT